MQMIFGKTIKRDEIPTAGEVFCMPNIEQEELRLIADKFVTTNYNITLIFFYKESLSLVNRVRLGNAVSSYILLNGFDNISDEVLAKYIRKVTGIKDVDVEILKLEKQYEYLVGNKKHSCEPYTLFEKSRSHGTRP